MEDFIKKLEKLRQEMPDPFRVSNEIQNFYTSEVAKELISGGKKTISAILGYLKDSPDSALISPSVLLLAYFEPELFYRELLTIVAAYRNTNISGFELGLWKIKKGEKEIANDLLKIVYSSKNPYVLLLLQRPVIVFYKMDLKKIIETGKSPDSLYALYCYKYALKKDDSIYLQKFINSETVPEIKILIENYLLELKKL